MALLPLVAYAEVKYAQMPFYSALAFCVPVIWILVRVARKREFKTLLVICLYLPATWMSAMVVDRRMETRAQELRSLVKDKDHESARLAFKEYCARSNSPCRFGANFVMLAPDTETIVFSQFMERRYVLHVTTGAIDRPTTAY